jgi:hypothetical protein
MWADLLEHGIFFTTVVIVLSQIIRIWEFVLFFYSEITYKVPWNSK